MADEKTTATATRMVKLIWADEEEGVNGTEEFATPKEAAERAASMLRNWLKFDSYNFVTGGIDTSVYEDGWEPFVDKLDEADFTDAYMVTSGSSYTITIEK